MEELFQRLKQRKMVQWALAYSAAAVATVRGLSPLPGRALTVGLNARW